VTITIQNEIQLWFDKKGAVTVRCGACGGKPETAKGAQNADQARYMLNCPKHGTLVEYGSPEELATDAIAELQFAIDELNKVLSLLENGAASDVAETEPELAK